MVYPYKKLCTMSVTKSALPSAEQNLLSRGHSDRLLRSSPVGFDKAICLNGQQYTGFPGDATVYKARRW